MLDMFWKNSAIKEIQKGIKELFPRLWRYCFILSGNAERANDLAQSTCLRALEKSHQYTVGTELDRWLFRIAKNIWLNELRSDAVRDVGGMPPVEEIDLPDHSPGPESNLINKEVLLSVMSLPEAQRIVVGLVYIEGYSYGEAAKILDIPVGTIMSRLSTARLKLAKKLKPHQSGAI